MSIIKQLSAWQKARQPLRKAKVTFPDKDVFIWEAADADVGVIEKRPGGRFLDFHVENRPFGVVKGVYKRRATLMRKEAEHGHR